MLRAAWLPVGVACVRVQTSLGTVEICSARLTEEERRVARIMAYARARRGRLAYVMVGALEVLDVVAELA